MTATASVPASAEPIGPEPAARRAPAADFDVRDMMDGAVLLASTANVVMQLARPAVGYGVTESKVDGGQVMRHPFRRVRNTVTYLSVALIGTEEERAFYRRQVSRTHARICSDADSPVSYNAFDPRLQLWVAACLYRGCLDTYRMLHGPVDEGVADAIFPRRSASRCRCAGPSATSTHSRSSSGWSRWSTVTCPGRSRASRSTSACKTCGYAGSSAGSDEPRIAHAAIG